MNSKNKERRCESNQELIDKILTKRLHRERQLIASRLGLDSILELDLFIENINSLKRENNELKDEIHNKCQLLLEKETLISVLLKGITLKHLDIVSKLAILEIQKNKSVDEAIDTVLESFEILVGNHQLVGQQRIIVEKEKSKMKQKIDKIINTIDAMKDPFNSIGHRLHLIITQEAPELIVDLWYGSVAYKDPNTKKVICFFRLDSQFTFSLGEDAYFGFDKDNANAIQPSAWFLVNINESVEAKIREIVRSAINMR